MALAAAALAVNLAAQGTTCSLIRDIESTPDATVSSAPTPSRSPSRGLFPKTFLHEGGFWYFRADQLPANGLYRTDGTAGGTVQLLSMTAVDTIDELTGCNGSVFFVPEDELSYGSELWKTDGTAVGTALVKDIWPGADGSSIRDLTCFGTQLLFVAQDGSSGMELWTSDGTSAGTLLLKDINPGSGSSNPMNLCLTPDGSALLFSADDGTNGRELWITDGTTAGTTLLADIQSGSGSSSPGPCFVFAGKSLFTADDGTHGVELWVTDGTTAGTTMLADIIPGAESSSPQFFGDGTLGSEFLFFADGASIGRELWKTDGTTAGTVLVKDINPGSSSSSASHIEVAAGLAYFDADDGTTGRELWRSDGTTAGTFVLDINPGSGPSYPESGIELGGRFYFPADGGSGNELWSTDGTAAGTTLAVDLEAETESDPLFLTPISSTQFLATMTTAATGDELYLSDGTTSGTRIVLDIGVVVGSGVPYDFYPSFGQTMFFVAQDVQNGSEPWSLDAAGSRMLADINPGTGSSYPTGFCSCWMGTEVLTFFSADDGVHGVEPWVTDGTAAGTRALADLNSGSASSFAYGFVACGTKVLFIATAANGIRLFVSDGTTAGTQAIDGPQNPYGTLYRHQGRVYFASAGGNGIELWGSDGTTAGTMQLADINPAGSSSPDGFASLGDELFFAATSAVGRELWKTDGTSAGTTLVADIRVGSGSSNPRHLVACGSDLFFAADDGVSGNELWKSDGTGAGTLRLTDISRGSVSSDPINLTCAADGQRLFFLAHNIVDTGLEPWVSDGTVAGTTMIADLTPGVSYRRFTDFVPAGDGVYFGSDSDSGANLGQELWFSDGTAAGTQLLCDVQPGPLSSNPQSLTLFQGTLYFLATTEQYGSELYGLAGVAHSQPMSADGNGPNLSTLRATPPLLGGTLSFGWTHGPDNWAGVLFIDFAQPPFPAMFFANDSYGVVRIVSILGVELVSQGEQSIAVPDIEVLLGVPANAQLWWIDPTLTSPYIEVSNGVALTFGR